MEKATVLQCFFFLNLLFFKQCFALLSNAKFVQPCGKSVSLSLTPTHVAEKETFLRCVAMCAESAQCSGINYLGNRRERGKCEIFLFDPVNPCDVTKPIVGGNYFRRPKLKICQNGGTPASDRKSCDCPGSWVGYLCERYARDCTELYAWGKRPPLFDTDFKANHLIQLSGILQPVPVVCILKFGGLVAVHLNKGNCNDFAGKTWNDYKVGFGEYGVTCGYWIGNEKLSALTQQESYMADIWIHGSDPCNPGGSQGNLGFYNTFVVRNESMNFELKIGNFYNGGIGNSMDSLTPLLSANGMSFSTPDRDNDQSASNCAMTSSSGWWFNDCSASNLNAKNPEWKSLNDQGCTLEFAKVWLLRKVQLVGDRP